jgi:hypothetical protein
LLLCHCITARHLRSHCHSRCRCPVRSCSCFHSRCHLLHQRHGLTQGAAWREAQTGISSRTSGHPSSGSRTASRRCGCQTSRCLTCPTSTSSHCRACCPTSRCPTSRCRLCLPCPTCDPRTASSSDCMLQSARMQS